MIKFQYWTFFTSQEIKQCMFLNSNLDTYWTAENLGFIPYHEQVIFSFNKVFTSLFSENSSSARITTISRQTLTNTFIQPVMDTAIIHYTTVITIFPDWDGVSIPECLYDILFFNFSCKFTNAQLGEKLGKTKLKTFEHLTNENSFFGKLKTIFHHFLSAIVWWNM